MSNGGAGGGGGFGGSDPSDDTVPAGFAAAMGGWNHLNFALAHHLPSKSMYTRRIMRDVLNVLNGASGKRR